MLLWPDRDFLAGKSILENIEVSMESSAFIVFLLTEDFMKSNYCDHEKNVAQEIMCSGAPNFRIIPILLGECKVPHSLRFVNYIDAKKMMPDELVKSRLYAAMVKGGK